MAELPGELGGGFEDFGSLDERTLYAKFGIALDDGLDGFFHKACAHFHELVMDVACCVGVLDAAFLTEDDSSGIDVVVNHEGRDSGNLLPVDDRPVDGGGAAVLWQQGSVEVEGAELWHGPDLLRKHPEGHDDEDIGLPGAQCFQELRILQLDWLQDGNTPLDGESLYSALVDLEAASRRLVGDGDHARYLIPLVDQCLEGGDGELRRTHVDYACLLKETDDVGFELAPGCLELVGVEGRVLRGLPDQEDAYGD